MLSARLFTSLVLAIWLGTYAFRAYIPAAVWNLSDELPFHLKAVIAVATQAAALLGALMVFKWRRRTLAPLALAFAAVTVVRQLFLTNDAVGPYLALAGWPLWCWLMAALADEVSAHDADTLLAPAFGIAIALQLGAQSAWHGLDLASVRGPLAVGASAVLALLLAFNVSRIANAPLPRPHTSWAWVLLGPALFLELTLAGNLGRMSEILRTSVLTTVILLQISLFAGVLVAVRFTRFAHRIAVIAIACAALFVVPGLTGTAALVLLAIQPVIIAGLREAADPRMRISAAAAFTLAGLILFALVFGFYSAYELPPLWLLALAPLAIAAGLAKRAGVWPAAPTVTWFAAACALAVLNIIPPPPTLQRAADSVSVMSYNIHHGFDDTGVPGMQRIADEIAKANADLIALQEIGRGWTLLGGNDLAGYLRWRLPDYAVTYSPVNGQLWGLATMSRLPVVATGSGVFGVDPGAVRYGWSGVLVHTPDGQLEFYSVHVTPDLAGPMGDARLAQTQALQQVLREAKPVIVAGDFNAHPEDEPIQSMSRAFSDLGAAVGLADRSTWPAGSPAERIDYVFARGMRPVSGWIPRTTASDHLPVVIRVRFDDTTTPR